MIIATVSRNSLFAELLCKACEDENIFILEKTDHLSKISETEDYIIVLLHIGGSETAETVGLTAFRQTHASARVIVIAENDLPQSTVEELGHNAEAVVQADLSAKALLGAVRRMRTGLRKDSVAAPYVAKRPRHSASAAARVDLKCDLEVRLRSALNRL